MSPLELCVKGDLFLVSLATKFVKGWNWTTGKTRADIAAIVHSSSAILAPMNSLANGDYSKGGLYAALFGVGSIDNAQAFYEIDDLEAKFQQAATLDTKIMEFQQDAKHISQTTLAAGAVAVMGGEPAFGKAQEPIQGDFPYFGAGLVTVGISHYLMRAEYVRPRKSCIHRGIDKLSDISQSSLAQPAYAQNS